MNILFLAPHPFYQERGTPIAVRLLLGELSQRGDHVDVLTYHEGEDVSFPGILLHRIPRLPGIRRIPPGFSLKKLICDVFLFAQAWRMIRRKRYHLVHAVEESVFIALWFKRIMGMPYVYDMDSSMSRQMAEKTPLFRPLVPLLKYCEGAAIRGALVVVPVCDALARIARLHHPRNIRLLRDVSLLSVLDHRNGARAENLDMAGTRFMYIGNLESYQGIDLLLKSFALLHTERNHVTLVIVGGTPQDIADYQAKAARLGIDKCVQFIGPRPVSMMAGFFRQADVLVSPRIRGDNTPMKIYSYLQSGKAILATDLPTHTQVLTPDVAMLAPPKPRRFADAMRYLVDNPEARQLLSHRAARLAEEQYSLPVFERTANELYQWLETQVLP